MNKKLIILILFLPLVLMLCLFTISNNVNINISIPVSNIEIIGNNIVYLNFDNNETYEMEYVIYPTNAKNKEVFFETEKVGDAPLAVLEFKDGYIIPKSCGKAKVFLTTVDGGFKDSFIVQVDSKKLQDIICVVENSSIYVGETTNILTTFIPSDVSDNILKYEIPQEYKNIISVTSNGVIKGLSKGYAEIIVKSASNANIKKTISIEIKNKDIIDLGVNELSTWKKSGSIIVSLDTNEDCDFNCLVFDENNEAMGDDKVKISLDYSQIESDILVLNYQVLNESYLGTIKILVNAETESGLVVSKQCEISFIDKISASFDSDDMSTVKVGANTFASFTITPQDADVIFETELSNDNITVEVIDNLLIIKGEKLGVTNLTLKILNSDNKNEYVEIEKEVVVIPSDITINESVKTYGIENIYTLAKFETDGMLSKYNLTLSYGGNEIGSEFLENIYWTSSSSNAKIENGIITLTGESEIPEIVSFKAVFNYNGLNLAQSDEFKIRCVYDGVNIRSYVNLWNETNSETIRPLVIQNNIIDDFGVGTKKVYNEIETTYDKTYYVNTNSENKAKVKVLIQFKDDVYGNGYTINAHNIAWKQNSQNMLTNAIFDGPLNFVAMSESGGLVSVKAQDNICFAVYEGVTISNIELKGCNLKANENDEYDLTDLTYVGTVVEVLGDDVDIKYSRLTNGRTVVRAFGDILDKEKIINLNIQNSILSGAREFLLRLGTNCFVDGTEETPSPNIGSEELNFPIQPDYSIMTQSEKEDYDSKYIKTFVNVKNSVFKDAGIFAIGLDAHFSGPALANGQKYLGDLLKDWKNLAKTSYGVKLTFEDEVKLYNWKNIDDVDSSTLIEVLGETRFSDIKFDLADMVKTASENENFKNLIVKDEDSNINYVHAGIAFFGGGKNYSVFEGDMEKYLFNGYEVSLNDVGKSMLQAAAGDESFYFLINDSTTLNFLPKDQEEILNSKDAYSCIYKK